MLKVLVADDHPLFREAVVLAVRHLEGTDSQIFEAGTARIGLGGVLQDVV